ncbi:hypothetical protein Pyn_00870 [Prunus yedoensis var. nudiflora]|uniref:Uncharacterized protein n=1 Tax=Prunus yedoensis var. nudiflora TaxID=2094558 RepID=A0A314XS06_PRUYE|nr:hypothetical protein Pyn_00870 [Prunus yedoensis var. nudiflora]
MTGCFNVLKIALKVKVLVARIGGWSRSSKLGEEGQGGVEQWRERNNMKDADSLGAANVSTSCDTNYELLTVTDEERNGEVVANFRVRVLLQFEF